MDTAAPPDPADLPPVRRVRRRFIQVLIGVLIGIAVVVVQSAYGLDWNWMGMLGPAWIAAVALHEAGHVLAGLLAGYSIVSVSVWPLVANRHDHGWKVSIQLGAACGGFVRGYNRAADLRIREIALVSGGPMASLAACCIGAAFRSPGGIFLPCLSGISGFFLLAAALPARAGAPLQDLRRILILLRNGPDARFLLAASRILALDRDGVRPRDWPDIPGVSCPDEIRPDVAALWWLLRYNRATDAGNLPEAECALAKALRLSRVPELQISLRYTAAWFTAYMQRNLPAGERWYSSVPAGRDRAFALSRSMASAALALARGHYAEAAANLREARQLGDSISRGLRIAIEETLDRMMAEAEADLSRRATATDSCSA